MVDNNAVLCVVLGRERRKLIIPHELAYGERGHPPQIPRKSVYMVHVACKVIDGLGNSKCCG